MRFCFAVLRSAEHCRGSRAVLGELALLLDPDCSAGVVVGDLSGSRGEESPRREGRPRPASTRIRPRPAVEVGLAMAVPRPPPALDRSRSPRERACIETFESSVQGGSQQELKTAYSCLGRGTATRDHGSRSRPGCAPAPTLSRPAVPRPPPAVDLRGRGLVLKAVCRGGSQQELKTGPRPRQL